MLQRKHILPLLSVLLAFALLAASALAVPGDVICVSVSSGGAEGG